MFSREIKANRIKGFLMILALLILTTAFSGAAVRPARAAVTDPQAVKTAKKNKISKGKWVKKAKGIRYKKKNGSFVKSQWCMIDGNVYYFNAKGYVQTGSFQYKKCYYYADSTGKIYSSKLLKKGRKTYYYGSTGARVQARWKKIKGKYYYFSRTGEMVTNSWVGNRYVGPDGARVSNEVVDGREINSSGKVQNLAAEDNYIIVGASRIVDMSVAVQGTGTVFIAKGGQGYTWLKNTASKQLKKYLKEKPKSTVVFMLGHNDMNKVDSYIKYYKSLIKKYPKASFYFVNVLPNSKEKNNAKQSRLTFNKKMKAAFGRRCIDAENYLKSQGCLYKTVDGTHYPQKVSRLLYQYIMKKVGNKNSQSGSGSGTSGGTQSGSGSGTSGGTQSGSTVSTPGSSATVSSGLGVLVDN